MLQSEELSVGQRLRHERLAMNWSQERLAEALGTSVMTVRRWEHNVVYPQPRFRELLCQIFRRSNEELFGPSVHTRSEIPARPEFWAVPYLRNPYFTGREGILETIHTQFSAHRSIALGQTFALTGLGGIGKTQVAIEYAYRYASAYYAIFWLAAETSESIMASMQQIAELLQLPESQTAGQSQMVTAVQRWLTTHQGWLLIGDNVEDLGILQMMLPPTQRGALLLTTRRQTLGTFAELLELPPMNDEEGAIFVQRRARITNIPSALASGSPSEITKAVELVRLLEGLPLALDQASGYIEETGCSVADYLQRYNGQRMRLLARRGIHAGAHPASVKTTLQLSVQWIERVHPAAVDLLRLCAFLHAEAIPEDLLMAGEALLGPVLGSVLADTYQFDLALAALRNASLVTRHPETRTLSVHRLVQTVLQDQMEPAELYLWGQRTVKLVNAAFPAVEFATWHQCERYLAHALACVPLATQVGSDLIETGELFYKAGNYLMMRGRYEEAKPLLTQAVALGEQQFGPDHPALIPRLLKRAKLSCWKEENEYAEQLLLRALTLGERHLAPTHPQIAEVLSDLVKVYRQQQKHTQAEQLYQRALHIQEQQLKSELPETVVVLSHLATIYQQQGKSERAEPLLQRALRIQEQQLGPQHPQIVETLNALATLYYNQDQYEQAQQLYLRALRIQEQHLRSEHPSTATVLNNLANLYRMQGKHEQAEPLYQWSLRIREQQLGPEHPEMATAFHQLALLYHELEWMEQAESVYQRALSISERGLGPTHPGTVNIRNDYNRFLQQGKSAR